MLPIFYLSGMFTNLKFRITTGWDFFRFLRAALAILVLAVSIKDGDLLLIAAGSFISLQVLLNIGCCGANGCAVYPEPKKIKKGADS